MITEYFIKCQKYIDILICFGAYWSIISCRNELIYLRSTALIQILHKKHALYKIKTRIVCYNPKIENSTTFCNFWSRLHNLKTLTTARFSFYLTVHNMYIVYCILYTFNVSKVQLDSLERKAIWTDCTIRPLKG